MMTKIYSVYIMTNKPFGTLYVGVTNHLIRRVLEHKERPQGFVKEHCLNKLVYATCFYEIEKAIAHEKRLKKWQRHWKTSLIKRHNPLWEDLTEYYRTEVFGLR